MTSGRKRIEELISSAGATARAAGAGQRACQESRRSEGERLEAQAAARLQEIEQRLKPCEASLE